MGDYARRLGIEHYPFVQKLMQNPAYTEFWSLQAVDKWMAARPLTVPTLLEVGQWDQEDSYGAPAVYKALKDKYEGSGLLHLAIGPWRHSGANHYGYELGALTFNGDTAAQWRTQYVKPFFDHYLKGAPDPRHAQRAHLCHRHQSVADQPALADGDADPAVPDQRQWRELRPAGDRRPRRLCIRSREAGAVPPASSEHGRPRAMAQLAGPRSAVRRRPARRPTYTSAPLTSAVHIMGPPQVDLFAATSGTDSDWVVKLIDVYPNETPEGASQGSKPDMSGFELPVGIEIFRGRYVDSFARPRALKAGKVEHYRWSLPNVNHVFLPRHRIAVQVQSSLFPLYDRNPQTFVPNIFVARPGDYRKATQSVYRGGATASAVLLPVVP